MTETSIQVSSLGIKFSLSSSDEGAGWKSTLRSLFFARKKKEFWALKDVSFESKKGEILGIAGPNGAGKSTLLKVIAGIYPSTEGDIRLQGRIAPLIELGAAFNPELSGTENIFLTGSIYRIPRRKIQENFDRIVDFSGLRPFIHTPVKNYSSGMFIRLAFSIIIFFQPEIVLIDEVFSVGDEVFQKKSFEKILSFQKQGATILLVTHDTKLITQICSRAMIMNKGQISFLGEPEEAVEHYHELIERGEGLDADTRTERPPPGPLEGRRWGTKQVDILSVQFVDKEGKEKKQFQTGNHFEARIRYVSHLEEAKAPIFGVAINTIYKLLIYGPNTLEAKIPETIPREGTVRFIIPELPLLEGDYLFSVTAYDETLHKAYDHHEMMYNFKVLPSGGTDFGSIRIHSDWRVEEG